MGGGGLRKKKREREGSLIPLSRPGSYNKINLYEYNIKKGLYTPQKGEGQTNTLDAGRGLFIGPFSKQKLPKINFSDFGISKF